MVYPPPAKDSLSATQIFADRPIRWGIASAGKISGDFVVALQSLPKEHHEVVAIGARSLAAAEDFAKKYNLPKAYGSYAELAKADDIDIIYIGSINSTHHQIAMLCFEQKKHVLTEKPMGISVKETEEMIAAAKKADVFFMEGVWTRFHPGVTKIRDEIFMGTIGDPVRVEVSFGLNMLTKDRVMKKNMGGGSCLDIGIYNIQLAVMVFRGEPKEVISVGQLSQEGPEGVDIATSSILIFDDDKNGNKRHATLNTDLRTDLTNEAVIVGTKGMIRIKSPFWASNTITINDVVYDYPTESEGYFHANSYFFRHEIEAVRDCLNKGLKECTTVPHNESLILARTIARVMKGVGVQE